LYNKCRPAKQIKLSQQRGRGRPRKTAGAWSHQHENVEEQVYSDKSDSEDNVAKTKKVKKKVSKIEEEVDTDYSYYVLMKM
jgi:hypothetical protein